MRRSLLFRLIAAATVVVAFVPSLTAEVVVTDFGTTADGKPVKLFTMTNSNKMKVELISRGATIRSIHVPDTKGEMADVCNGFDTVAGYESDANQYFGCTAGRVCNRIGDAKFELDGLTYKLTANDGDNTLHGGGARSFDKVVWDGVIADTDDARSSVKFEYFSPDGEEGFPGNLHVSVTYTLTDSNSLVMTYDATSDLPTPINLTNHAYFNLAGNGSGTILEHVLMIDAPSYTPTDEELIPTGEIASVEGTALDFREPTAIGKRLDQVASTPAKGYDHNWVLKAGDGSIRKVAKLLEPKSGRTLEVHTDQPGLQFYSGNFLFGQPGKEGKTYVHRGALCLETQHFPDSVNHENFPSTILRPAGHYHTTTIYRFGVEKSAQ